MLTLKRLSSKSRSGPVAPTITSGCPAKSAKTTPAADVATNVSDIPIIFWVLSAVNSRDMRSNFDQSIINLRCWRPSFQHINFIPMRPPNVIDADNAAKYMNIAAAMVCKFRPSLRSDQ